MPMRPMSTMTVTGVPVSGEVKKPPAVCTSPMMMPPQNAPVMLPKPPIATATKAGSAQFAPTSGVIAR